jgi:16S rRNA (adenine1518-N6/adenine1519-N6)-dimethyltransferase
LGVFQILKTKLHVKNGYFYRPVLPVSHFSFHILHLLLDHKAKKAFGQHFLKDMDVVRQTVQALPDPGNFTVVEIGPGRGVLTAPLLERYADKFYAVEVDDDLIPVLQKQFPALGNRLIHQDFLKFDWSVLPDGDIIVVGNFPYNISSQILFTVLDEKDRVIQVVGMFQKEVGVRVISGPGKKDYGILSVLLAAWYKMSLICHIPPESFSPPPKVDSVVINLQRNDRKTLPCNQRVFKQVVKAAFNQRRKMLRNSLSSFQPNEETLTTDFFTRRPEQMSLEDFFAVTQMLEKKSE